MITYIVEDEGVDFKGKRVKRGETIVVAAASEVAAIRGSLKKHAHDEKKAAVTDASTAHHTEAEE